MSESLSDINVPSRTQPSISRTPPLLSAAVSLPANHAQDIFYPSLPLLTSSYLEMQFRNLLVALFSLAAFAAAAPIVSNIIAYFFLSNKPFITSIQDQKRQPEALTNADWKREALTNADWKREALTNADWRREADPALNADWKREPEPIQNADWKRAAEPALNADW